MEDFAEIERGRWWVSSWDVGEGIGGFGLAVGWGEGSGVEDRGDGERESEEVGTGGMMDAVVRVS